MCFMILYINIFANRDFFFYLIYHTVSMLKQKQVKYKVSQTYRALKLFFLVFGGRRGREHMVDVVGFAITYAINAYHN